ncbi:MAG: nucleotidyltransferase family protein [Alphaproteobacteria bacterium]|nr:nucleotidyltransferase family protein [Alphaproteobacteria bacterium]
MTKNSKIDQAMVLAAGLGSRMRPLTDERPKPLVPLGGVTLIDRVFGRLKTQGVTKTVVNAHYRAAQIEAHMKGRAGVTVIYEPERLETGGGVLNALPEFGGNPFFVINSDAVWLDGPTPTLSRLAALWDGETMDALLLMHRMTLLRSESGIGDYFLSPLGVARRRLGAEVAPYLFAGVQILHPRLFEDCAPGAFSLNRLYDAAQKADRLYGMVHDGEWYHVGTPTELRIAEYSIAHEELPVNTR